MSDKQIDELFRKVVQHDAEEQSRILIEQRSEKPDIPELYKARFEQMLDRELPMQSERKERFVLSRTAKRIIAAAAASVIVMFGLIMTSEAARSRVTQWIVSFLPGYAEIGLEGIEDLPPSDTVIYQLTYIPDGYRLVSETHVAGQRLLYQKSEEELIDFEVLSSTGVSQLDTEKAIKTEYTTILGETGLLIVYDDWTALTWSNEMYLFIVEGTVSEEEIIKIANSMTTASDYPYVKPEDRLEHEEEIEVPIYMPGFVPDGFEMREEQFGEDQKLTYLRGKDTILFCVCPEDADLQIDTEQADKVETVTVRGTQALLLISGDRTALTWTEEQKQFLIEGNLTKEEALQMADSICIGIYIVKN